MKWWPAFRRKSELPQRAEIEPFPESMSDILFADDDEALREMVVAALRAGGHEVRPVASGTEALLELRRSTPDLLLLDYRMGTPDGFEVCRQVKADPRLSHLPVLILTGEGKLEDRLQGFDAGADDYLGKPFDPRELLARVGALLRLARLGFERNPTTGLPGGETIHVEIDRWRSEGLPFAVCYLDLDYFKPFSDRFGFAVADRAIHLVGEVMQEVGARRRSFVGHVGGDDFVMLCPASEARGIAEEIQTGFADQLSAFLPSEAVHAGRYRAPDREGIDREFPLTGLSIAIVRVDPARWSSLQRLGEVVAEIKRLAKGGESVGIAEAELL